MLLTTRSKELRSHPGQTALPGGKVDKTDAGVVETAVSITSNLCPIQLDYRYYARWSDLLFFFLFLVDNVQFREANEEVAFPLGSPHVHTLCTLEPFVSQHRVLVTPVITFLDDISVLEELRAAPGEVARIFDHPLEALLDPGLLRDSEEKLVPLGSEDWPYETELHVSYSIPLRISLSFPFLFGLIGAIYDGAVLMARKQNCSDVPWLGTMYRMHRFRSTASPVKGLTADILVRHLLP